VTAEAGGNAGPNVTMEAAPPTALHALTLDRMPELGRPNDVRTA
jgi:hypothetical protein